MNWEKLIDVDDDIFIEMEKYFSIIINGKDDLSLFNGKSVMPLYYLYLHKSGRFNLFEKISSTLCQVFNELPKELKYLDRGLNGCAGLLFLLKFMKEEEIIIENDRELIRFFEYAVRKFCVKMCEKGIYDLLVGSIGIGNYFLSKKSINKVDVKYISDILNSLMKNGIVEKDMIRWVSYKEFNINAECDEINFGFAHGIPSIISFLSKCIEKNICNELSENLLKMSVEWVLKQKMNKSVLSLFPIRILTNDGTVLRHNYLRWCYGDLGIAYSILKAGIVCNNTIWVKEANSILENIIEKNLKSKFSVEEPYFCHGTVGVAHIFNRIYQLTEKSIYKKEAVYWYNQSVLKLSYILELAKYNKRNKKYILLRSDLLNGIAGIGISLLSASSDIEPKWDELFLLS